MARLSNIIEEFIKELIKESEDKTIEIKRNELANKFECAPSQINYVLTTRFTVEKGYYIESKRGGGGYIKIVKNNLLDKDNIYIKNIVENIVGNSVTGNKGRNIVDSLVETNILTEKEGNIMKGAISSRYIQNFEQENQIRADVLKNMFLAVLF